MAALVGCEEVIDLELNNDPRVVIEAVLTDGDLPACRVLVTESTDYFSTSNTQYAANALVVLSDDAGWSDTLELAPPDRGFWVQNRMEGPSRLKVHTHPVPMAWYVSAPGWTPDPNRVYALSVTVDGKVYRAQQAFSVATPLDSLQVNYFDDPPVYEPGYYLRIFFQDLPGPENRALFSYYVNDSLAWGEDQQFVADFEFVEGQYLIIDYDGPFPGNGDTLLMESASLTYDAVRYLDDWELLTDGLGGPFAPPPWNSDIEMWSGGALGYFRVSRLSRKSIVLPED